MDSISSRKNVRISREQKALMIKLVRNARCINNVRDKNYVRKMKSVWTMISSELNSLEGAEKSADAWRKTWVDMKSHVKRQYAEEVQSRNAGYGPSVFISPLDLKILELLEEERANSSGNKEESNQYKTDVYFANIKRDEVVVDKEDSIEYIGVDDAELEKDAEPFLKTEFHEENENDSENLLHRSTPSSCEEENCIFTTVKAESSDQLDMIYKLLAKNNSEMLNSINNTVQLIKEQNDILKQLLLQNKN